MSETTDTSHHDATTRDSTDDNLDGGLTLVLGATGKTGARVAARLHALGHAVRPASRRTDPPFEWNDPATWDGRNEFVTGDVEHVLGRPPRDFAAYARATAATGVWDVDTEDLAR